MAKPNLISNENEFYDAYELIRCSLEDKWTKKEDNISSLPTYVIGLDDLLRGGLLLPPKSGNGLIILLKGQPGTGKTTLAMQLAKGACRWESELIDFFKNKIKQKTGVNSAGCQDCQIINDEIRMLQEYQNTCNNFNSIVFSHEQNYSDLELLRERLKPSLSLKDWDRQKEVQKGIQEQERKLLQIIPASENFRLDDPFSPQSTGLSWAYCVLRKLRGESSGQPIKWKHRMVVVDGLNLLSGKEQELFEMEALVSTLRQTAMVGVLVYEASPDPSEHIDYLADMIVELRGEEIGGPTKYFLQHLSIVKSRFQQSALGRHQYKIRGATGVNVFPSIHFHVHRIKLLEEQLKNSLVSLARNENQKSCTSVTIPPSLQDDCSALMRILGDPNCDSVGIKEGSCTVIMGTRRTWKTLLSLDFLRGGSAIKEKPQDGLLVSLMDNQETIIGEPHELCKWCCIQGRKKPCENQSCFQNVYLLHFRPGCISSSEFFYYLHKRLELAKVLSPNRPIQRLVFWDLTQMEYRFPLLANDRMFLPALMDYLKHTRKITSLFMGAANTVLSKTASAIADNVMFAWRDVRTKPMMIGKKTDEASKRLFTGKAQKAGIIFHVDRLEGRPESGSLFFMPERNIKEKLNNKYNKLILPVINVEKNIGCFRYAEQMRESIWAMQGLEARHKKGAIE